MPYGQDRMMTTFLIERHLRRHHKVIRELLVLGVVTRLLGADHCLQPDRKAHRRVHKSRWHARRAERLQAGAADPSAGSEGATGRRVDLVVPLGLGHAK